jgi:hypothetical protein
MGQQSGPQAKAFNDAIGITGIVLTKLDGTAKGGGALSASSEVGAPIVFVGTGEHSADFEKFDPSGFISRLLGMGDMLFLPPGSSKLQRIHGAYLSEEEINRLVEFLKQQMRPSYDESILLSAKAEDAEAADEDFDEFYDQAVALVAETGQASISMLQRRLRVGYNRAARMIEKMEEQGVVGPSDGVKARHVLINRL